MTAITGLISRYYGAIRFAPLAVLAIAAAGCGGRPEPPGSGLPEGGLPPSGAIAVKLLPEQTLASAPDLLAEGKALYAKQCAPCHGSDGLGDGQAAYLLYPRPRDFTRGQYRMVSTWEIKPTDADLYYTISRGMPGSAMPSWGHLAERQRWALVHHVKSLAREKWRLAGATEPANPGDSGTGAIQLPEEPADDDASRAHGKQLFAKGCAACHGPEARGDGTQEQRDDNGLPTRPRDLTLGVYKGDPSPAGVYKRIVLGLPGSPMPGSNWAHGAAAWHLTHFVRSLSGETQRERVEMRKFNLVAKRVETLPDHPDSSIWAEKATAVNLHLMPLWWRSDRPEEVTLRALHDGKSLALLLVWQDATEDKTAMRTQDFRDAAAIEFSPVADPPFFAMGEKGAPVSIWMWKSERQADLEVAFQDLEAVYPRLAIDSYPNTTLSGVEQPGRHALTLASDPTFVTAWGAGNIVADPTRRAAAEDLHAQGFGTLKARPRRDQKVDARGVWEYGTYRVFFRRTLAPSGAGNIGFVPGARVPVSVAVWNGSAGDRDGKKSVTIWQDLWLEK